MVTAFTIILMLVVAYAYMVEGLFNALTMFINTVLAGLVTCSFWEPLAGYLEPMFHDSFLAGYEDAICMTLIFWLTLVILRVGTNQFAPAEIDLHPVAQRSGGALFGLATGYVVSGFLLCMMQTLPWQVQFLMFDPDYKPEQVTRAYIPSDRVWLALMHRAGLYAFAAEGETFDPHGTFELRYARYRRIDNAHPLPYYGEFDSQIYQPSMDIPGATVPPGLSTGGASPPPAPSADAGAKK